MKRRFNIQLFAEGDPAGGGEGGQPGEGSGGAPGQGNPSQTPTYSQEDLDRILGERFDKWKQDQEASQSEADKLKKMTAQQRAEHDRDKYKKELEKLRRKDALGEMSKTARKMLSDKGIAVSDELLALMVTTEAEQTKAAVDSFAALFSTAVENAVKDRLRGEPPRRGTGSDGPADSFQADIDKRISSYRK